MSYAGKCLLYVNYKLSRHSSDYARFKEIFDRSKKIAVITGAGISAESGIPTFRGTGGLWRTYKAENLASYAAFKTNPSLVWEFYHYRREIASCKSPNSAHLALASVQNAFERDGGGAREIRVITQNVDELHTRAGSLDVVELHGSLFKVRCTTCGDETHNIDSPICEALRDKGNPDPTAQKAQIPLEDLPKCERCNGLLRPSIIWFGENLNFGVLKEARSIVDECDLCLIVGTSSIVYPAAMLAPRAADRGVPVAEFNLETTPATEHFAFHFEGPCGTTLPRAIK